jgi:hypothetical protein
MRKLAFLLLFNIITTMNVYADVTLRRGVQADGWGDCLFIVRDKQIMNGPCYVRYEKPYNIADDIRTKIVTYKGSTFDYFVEIETTDISTTVLWSGLADKNIADFSLGEFTVGNDCVTNIDAKICIWPKGSSHPITEFRPSSFTQEEMAFLPAYDVNRGCRYFASTRQNSDTANKYCLSQEQSSYDAVKVIWYQLNIKSRLICGSHISRVFQMSGYVNNENFIYSGLFQCAISQLNIDKVEGQGPFQP